MVETVWMMTSSRCFVSSVTTWAAGDRVESLDSVVWLSLGGQCGIGGGAELDPFYCGLMC